MEKTVYACYNVYSEEVDSSRVFFGKVYIGSRNLFVPDLAERILAGCAQIYEGYMECALIKPAYRRTGRKCGHKGDPGRLLHNRKENRNVRFRVYF